MKNVVRWTACALAMAAIATAAPARAADAEEAADHFRRGTEFYKQGDNKLALIEFERAYQLAPSYRVLYNIGQVNFQLANYAKALVAFRRYLSEGGAEVPADRRTLVEADIASLLERVASVRVKSNVEGAEVLVDDVPVGKTPLGEGVLVDAGQHVVRVTAQGYEPQQRVLTLAGRDRVEAEILLKKVEKNVVVVRTDEGSSVSAAPIIAWSLTGALATTALVTGILSLNSQSSLRSLRESESYVSSSELDSAASRAKTYALVADIAAAGAIVSAGVAVYFTFFDEKAKKPAPSGSAATTRFVGNGVAGTF
jgi:hypothetical protein